MEYSLAHNTTIIMYNNLKRAKCQGVIATHGTKKSGNRRKLRK